MEKRKTINRQNITDHLIEYQLKMIGKTIDEITTDEEWFSNNTMTPEQHEEFKAYAIPLLKKVFKFNKAKAEQTFSWFDLSYGLRINPN
jgi:uroporphyrinogen-III decarboxylase